MSGNVKFMCTKLKNWGKCEGHKKILSQLSIKITHIDLLLINKHVIYLNKALLVFVVIETLRQPIRCVYHCNIMKVFILEGVRMFWSLYCLYIHEI
jgi:hypothetical protein